MESLGSMSELPLNSSESSRPRAFLSPNPALVFLSRSLPRRRDAEIAEECGIGLEVERRDNGIAG